MEASKKATSELFANHTRLTLISFAVRRVSVVERKAWVRVEIEAQAIETQTGKEKLYAKTLNSIGVVYQRQGDPPIALEYFRRALARLGEAKGRTTVDVLQNMGDSFVLQEDHAQALPVYERALALAPASQDQPARARALIG